MNFDKAWIVIFFGVVSLWIIVLYLTLDSWATGTEPLVDKDVDLSLVTVPILGFSLLYIFTSMFIVVFYLLTLKRVKSYQLRVKARNRGREQDRSSSSDRHVLSFSSNNLEDGLCSIIIPAHNEQNTIKRTVLGCLKQTYKNIEVVVVCHNCSDRSLEEAQVPDSRVRVLDLRTKEVGKGIALNYGVNSAKGKYLLVLDGDGILSDDFIENALPLFNDNYAAVQGRYIPSNRNYNLVTRMLSLEGDIWSAPMMTLRSFIYKKCPLGGTGFIIRKDILMKVGMFRNHLVDDYELTFRLFRNKYKIAYAPLSICYDEKPPTLQLMMRQRSRWFKGFLVLIKHRLAESNDIIGNIYWFNPIFIISSFILLLVAGYSGIHNLMFGYYPFKYTYIPIDIWLLLTGMTIVLYALALIKQYGLRGARYAVLLPLFIAFSNYWFIASLKAFFVKSWATTKTTHGFMTKSDMEQLIRKERN